MMYFKISTNNAGVSKQTAPINTIPKTYKTFTRKPNIPQALSSDKVITKFGNHTKDIKMKKKTPKMIDTKHLPPSTAKTFK